MPGLRSLVARRRCSLPSNQLSSDPVICTTYPSVPGPISSRKGHSLDELHPNENVPFDKSSNDKSKWDLKSIFQVKEEPLLSAKQESDISVENPLYNSCNLPSITEIYLNGSEKENNHDVVQCQNEFFDPLEEPLKQEIKSEPLSHEENEFENDFKNENGKLSKNVSPERIVIKMKLLHGSSLSDVTNISADSSDSNECIKSELLYEQNCALNTQWTIDSIMNQPFVESEFSDSNNSNSSNLLIKNTSIPVQDLECKDNKENINCIDEKDPLYPISCDSVDDNSLCKESTVDIAANTNNFNNLQEKSENFVINSQINENKLIENTRRASDSSDVSEDSICSEASTGSSLASSDSSVKSCSIVIKRLENSDTYSCFRSPKSKRKKHQENELTKTVYLNGKSLPILYIQKRLLYNSDSDILPCSVTLCDIFSNYPFRKEKCPRCCRIYNLESDVLVDACYNTLTLQCLTCKWLVVRSLKAKEIDLIPQSRNYN